MVATIYPLADWVSNVGGKRVKVITLLPAGNSPHTFEPSPSEMKTVSRAALFVKAGLQLDDWGAQLAAASPKLTVLSLGDELQKRKLLPDVDAGVLSVGTGEGGHSGHDDHGGVNPHFWLDPVLAAEAAPIIAAELSRVAPAYASEFKANAEEYARKLRQLDEQIRQELRPVQKIPFVTYHNGFAYFAKRYGLNILAVIEEYPGKTPSERYVKDVISKIRSAKAKAVFSEPQLSSRAAEVVAHEDNLKMGVLDYLGGPSVAGRESYINMIHYNADQLVKNLQ